jgi:hypothetical protein
MTRNTLVSAFSRAALVTSLAFAAGCDTTVADAHVDLDAMNQAELPMERLMALADMTVFQVERGVDLQSMPGIGGSTDVGEVVVTAFGEKGSAVFLPSAGLVGPSTVGQEPDEDEEPSTRPGSEEDKTPRGFRLLWANFTSGGLGLNGDLELHNSGLATADVAISMGGSTADLEMTGSWRGDTAGADVTMSGSMTDDQGMSWRVQTDELRLDVGCTVAAGGRWLAEATTADASTNPLRFEVVYEDNCGGCADLFVNDTPIGRSCVGGAQ